MESLFIIEAKDSKVSLEAKKVKDQAKSYAFAIGTPLYVITNGEQIYVYKWTPEEDHLIISVHITELAQKWKIIRNILGAGTSK